MTYEQAAYFRVLLLCGYSEEFDAFLESAVKDQERVSDVVLELFFCGSDREKTLAVLKNYLTQVRDEDIDYENTVFNMLLSFLRSKYVDKTLTTAELTELMYLIARNVDRDGDPWSTMYLMSDYSGEVECGWGNKEDFLRKFDAFITDGICF